MSDQSSQKLKELLRRIEQLPTEAHVEPRSISTSLPHATITIVPEPLLEEELPETFSDTEQQTEKRSHLGVMMIAGLAAVCGIGGLLFLKQPSTETRVDANLHRTASAASTAIGAKADVPIADATPQVQEVVPPTAPSTQVAQAMSTNSSQATSPQPQARTSVVTPAKLVVQPVTIGSGQRTAITIRSEPPLPADSPFQIRVRRLPAGMSFSLGTRVDADGWTVSVPQLANLELISTDVQPGRFSLQIEAVSSDGRVVAAADGLVTVTGTVPLADTERLNEEEQSKLLGQGLVMLASGNVNSARLLLQRAADAGNARAALILGDTYDSERLSRIGATSVVPDRDKAAFWYSRADELGAPEAKERLSQINAR